MLSGFRFTRPFELLKDVVFESRAMWAAEQCIRLSGMNAS